MYLIVAIQKVKRSHSLVHIKVLICTNLCSWHSDTGVALDKESKSRIVPYSLILHV